ncbi:hypothetical protein V8E54_013748 [Elaphomyces granulatus]
MVVSGLSLSDDDDPNSGVQKIRCPKCRRWWSLDQFQSKRKVGGLTKRCPRCRNGALVDREEQPTPKRARIDGASQETPNTTDTGQEQARQVEAIASHPTIPNRSRELANTLALNQDASSSNEDFNIPSKDRLEHLKTLKSILSKNKIPRVLWAVLQCCDISCLQQWVNISREKPKLILTETALLM